MCPKCYCPECHEEMIHRDNRKGGESSSGFGQIMRRDGPNGIGFMDIDGCAFRGFHSLLTLMEHKQPEQALDPSQETMLKINDEIINIAKVNPSERLRELLYSAPYADYKRLDDAVLHEDSGVYIIRGQIGVGKNKQIGFLGPQRLRKMDSRKSLPFTEPHDLFTFVHGDKNWTPRNNKSRTWRVR